ncbi:hypothetical protein F0726_01329 [Acidithiobacillus caldus]|nr:hypothetical protein F0726_01329 [Acidithiobacillus caldus]
MVAIPDPRKALALLGVSRQCRGKSIWQRKRP